MEIKLCIRWTRRRGARVHRDQRTTMKGMIEVQTSHITTRDSKRSRLVCERHPGSRHRRRHRHDPLSRSVPLAGLPARYFPRAPDPVHVRHQEQHARVRRLHATVAGPAGRLALIDALVPPLSTSRLLSPGPQYGDEARTPRASRSGTSSSTSPLLGTSNTEFTVLAGSVECLSTRCTHNCRPEIT